uniref:Uncharacterized protein n=1 Tax=Glossina austeni TaxID=7395 RepID=A0A1A9UH68_GLOAU
MFYSVALFDYFINKMRKLKSTNCNRNRNRYHLPIASNSKKVLFLNLSLFPSLSQDFLSGHSPTFCSNCHLIDTAYHECGLANLANLKSFGGLTARFNCLKCHFEGQIDLKFYQVA